LIDIEFIKSKIFVVKENENDKKIQSGDLITKEVIEILKKGNHTTRQLCFAPLITPGGYFVEVECQDCGMDILKKLGKTGILDYLKDKEKEKFRCEKCDMIFEQNKIQKEKDHAINIDSQRRKDTDWFIEIYINPENSWKEKTPLKQKIKKIIYPFKRGYGSGWYLEEWIKEAINLMEYSDFLRTPYWNAISLYAKSKSNFSCQLCNSKENLRTHHRTYERHGYEHRDEVIKQDLIVLCNDCHSKFHDICED